MKKILLISLIFCSAFAQRAGYRTSRNTVDGDLVISGSLNVTGNLSTSSNLSVVGTVTSTIKVDTLTHATATRDLTIKTSAGNKNILLMPNGTGKVGIGTTAPSYNLDVVSDIRATNEVKAGATTVFMSLSSAGVVPNINTMPLTLAGFGDGIRFNTWDGSSLEKMRLSSSGNLGIGTTGPIAKLEINTTGSTAGLLVKNTAGGNVLYVSPTGTVGIGITNPTSTFASNASANWFTNSVATGGNYYIRTNDSGTAFWTQLTTSLLEWGPGNNTYDVILKRESAGNASFTGNLGFGTTAPAAQLHLTSNITRWDSTNVQRETSNIADDGTITLAASVAGRGFIFAGDIEQYAEFIFDTNAAVTLLRNSAKVSKTSAAGDDSLMVYDGGTSVIIKNRLGSAKKICVDVIYYVP
jgi:hypothetical protein